MGREVKRTREQRDKLTVKDFWRILALPILFSLFSACGTFGGITAPGDQSADIVTESGLLSNKPLTTKTCTNHTPSEVTCIDCCDSLDTDGEGRRSCRYACKQHDFSLNTEFVYIESPSILGPDGDYTTCTAAGLQGECKVCCDESSELESGDRKFCREACDRLPDQWDMVEGSAKGEPSQDSHRGSGC
jgi:hypothetical protein